MSERVDLGVELAGFTDFDHHGTPRRRSGPYVDQVTHLRISGPSEPPPPWVITDPPHPNQMPIPPDAGAPPPLIDRCAQCQRYIPIKGPHELIPRRWALYCDECAWMHGDQ